MVRHRVNALHDHCREHGLNEPEHESHDEEGGPDGKPDQASYMAAFRTKYAATHGFAMRDLRNRVLAGLHPHKHDLAESHRKCAKHARPSELKGLDCSLQSLPRSFVPENEDEGAPPPPRTRPPRRARGPTDEAPSVAAGPASMTPLIPAPSHTVTATEREGRGQKNKKCERQKTTFNRVVLFLTHGDETRNTSKYSDALPDAPIFSTVSRGYMSMYICGDEIYSMTI